MNNNKYNYPILERVDTEIGRHYLDSNNKAVPSVTTILSGTSQSKAGIDQWRQRVGDKEADMNDLEERIKQGRGEIPADKVLSGGCVFDR